MAKEEKEAVEEEEDTEAEAEEAEDSEDEGGEGKSTKKTAKEEEESEDDEDGEADDDSEEDDSEEDDKGKKSKKSEEEAEPVIPVRKSVAEKNIIARQKTTIKKLRKEKADDADEDEDESDDSNVGKAVAKALAPVVEHLTARADEDDLKDLYASEPDAKKFDRSIRAYMKHPAYKGVAAEVIYHHLAWATAQKAGAKKKEVADKEAGKTKGAGSTKRPKGSKAGIPDAEALDSMTDEEFENLQNEVRQGKFKA